jgi:hypothetical protein
MKHIKLFERFTQEQSKYEDWEKGIIMAWGHVLYLAFHEVPDSIQKIVSIDQTKKSFLEYFKEAEDDEDMQDWLSDAPPTMNKGLALYDKSRLSKMLSDIANKTKLTKPLKVYRVTSKDFGPGWASYTVNIDRTEEYSDWKQPLGWHDNKVESYELPIGYPVIFADGIADKDEVILNISAEDKRRYAI